MKKGAVAAGAVALGGAATAGTAAAQQEGDVVILANDYFPGADFEVVTTFERASQEEIYAAVDEDEDVFDDVDDWDAYLIRYDVGTAGLMALLFSEEVDLSAGDSETMGESASVRNAELGLLDTAPGGGGGAGDDDEDEDEDGGDGAGDDGGDGGAGDDGGDGGAGDDDEDDGAGGG